MSEIILRNLIFSWFLAFEMALEGDSTVSSSAESGLVSALSLLQPIEKLTPMSRLVPLGRWYEVCCIRYMYVL